MLGVAAGPSTRCCGGIEGGVALDAVVTPAYSPAKS